MEQHGIQYNININQYELHKTKLDLVDCAILDYLIKFCGVDDKKVKQLTITEEGKMYQYTWVNFNYLIKQMPLLRIKDKSAISRRIDKIKKEGFIKIFRAPDRSLYVRLTEKIKEIEFANVIQKQQGCYSKTTGVLLDNNRGVAEKQQHNNNTNNSNTISEYSITDNKENTTSNKNTDSHIDTTSHIDTSHIDNTIDTIDSIYIYNIYKEKQRNKEIAELIDAFKEVNPSYKKLFNNTTQRKATDRLLEKFPFDDLLALIKNLSATNQEQFAPVIITPAQLENKLGSLIAFLQRKEVNKNKNKIVEI